MTEHPMQAEFEATQARIAAADAELLAADIAAAKDDAAALARGAELEQKLTDLRAAARRLQRALAAEVDEKAAAAQRAAAADAAARDADARLYGEQLLAASRRFDAALVEAAAAQEERRNLLRRAVGHPLANRHALHRSCVWAAGAAGLADALELPRNARAFWQTREATDRAALAGVFGEIAAPALTRTGVVAQPPERGPLRALHRGFARYVVANAYDEIVAGPMTKEEAEEMVLSGAVPARGPDQLREQL